MNGVHRDPWRSSAAYLYVLHLDGSVLAWEYLRRHPDYQRDWRRHHRRGVAIAQRWGLLKLEDPDLDARDAHPVWCPAPAGIVQLHPDLVPSADARSFDLWGIPGHKHLHHDGQYLALTAWLPGRWRHFALAPALKHGMRYVHAIHHRDPPQPTDGNASPWATARVRPSRAALLEPQTLQALDATLAGATLREAAEALVGPARVAADWHADSALRARVRRLMQRGAALMRGGYRHLLQRTPIAQGRSRDPAKRP